MRGRWAAGIVPRNFNWVIKDHLAISERPGGYAPTHRRVRRQEEILWLRGHGFTRVVSLLPSSHNLHAYSELGVEWSHYPMPTDVDMVALVSELYPQIASWMKGGERILIHQDELSDRLMGLSAGFLCWSGLLPEGPRAITALEQIVKRQMGSAGRAVVALLGEVPAAPHASATPAAEDANGAGLPSSSPSASSSESADQAVDPEATGRAGEAAKPSGAEKAPARRK